MHKLCPLCPPLAHSFFLCRTHRAIGREKERERANQRTLRATANFNTLLMTMVVCCSIHIERLYAIHTYTNTGYARVWMCLLCPCHIACYFNHNWLNSKFQRETHPLLCSIHTHTIYTIHTIQYTIYGRKHYYIQWVRHQWNEWKVYFSLN